MTDREMKRLNELLAKKEAEEAADRDFFKAVRKRKADVLKELNIDVNVLTEVGRIAEMYGCTVPELLRYIGTEQQVSYYKRTHG